MQWWSVTHRWSWVVMDYCRETKYVYTEQGIIYIERIWISTFGGNWSMYRRHNLQGGHPIEMHHKFQITLCIDELKDMTGEPSHNRTVWCFGQAQLCNNHYRALQQPLYQAQKEAHQAFRVADKQNKKKKKNADSCTTHSLLISTLIFIIKIWSRCWKIFRNLRTRVCTRRRSLIHQPVQFRTCCYESPLLVWLLTATDDHIPK